MNNYWKNRKLLITGGCGFIGSNAVDFFLKKGAIISATVSPNTSLKEIEKKLGDNISKINLIKINLLNKDDVLEVTKDVEVVMNFAAIDGGMKFKLENSLDIYRKNTLITKNLLKAAVRSKIIAFLLVSSSEIYRVDANNPLTEDALNIPTWSSEIDGYKLAKWQSEQDAIKIAKRFGLNLTIVRPANIFGPRDNFEDETKIRFIPSVIRKIYLDKNPVAIWGDGSQIKSFLYVEDFLEICALLIEKGIFNMPVNVASKNLITLRNLAEKIINLSRTNTQVITDSKKNSGPQKRIIDISLLENKIGPVKETSLDTGLKKTIDYFKISLNNKLK